MTIDRGLYSNERNEFERQIYNSIVSLVILTWFEASEDSNLSRSDPDHQQVEKSWGFKQKYNNKSMFSVL